MIELRGVSKRYQSQSGAVQALSHVDLHIGSAEIWGIIGKSGAGKSSLLRLVNVLERPCAGKVVVAGVDLLSLRPRALRAARHNIGMVFQHFNLLQSRTVFDNVAFALEVAAASRSSIDARVTQLLQWVGLEDRKYHYPDELSGGQKQRVAIARALASNPDVLLCDEVTSALDAESTHSILQLLKRIRDEFGVTILLITHELDVVRSLCDHVGVLDQGCLVETAPAEVFFSYPKHEVSKSLLDSAAALNSGNDSREVV